MKFKSPSFTRTSEDPFSDDIRQSFVVMKNELRKFQRGKKMLVFLSLVGLVLALLTVMPYILGSSLPKNAESLTGSYISFISIIVLLAVTLFTSTSLVSEYEERTALLLFTRPVRKSSIFLGKMMASMAISFVFIGGYYLFTALVSFIVAGNVGNGILASFGVAIAYTFGVSGISIMISSFAKKGSTASILTFITLLLLISIVTVTLFMNKIDTWWMIDEASNAIVKTISTEPADGMRPAIVMIIWGLVTSILAYLRFEHRDF